MGWSPTRLVRRRDSSRGKAQIIWPHRAMFPYRSMSGTATSCMLRGTCTTHNQAQHNMQEADHKLGELGAFTTS